jgi:hypothetical protein
MVAGSVLILSAQVGVVGSLLVPPTGEGGLIFLESLFLGLLGLGLLFLGRKDNLPSTGACG